MSKNETEKNLDWMYKPASNLVDREEYLLGRSIDKTLEQLNGSDKGQTSVSATVSATAKNHVEHECIPPSIRDYNNVTLAADQVDLSAKLQEDPLVAIRKREEEARRQFLQNPVQLKKLKEALKAQEKEKLKKKTKKAKKSKKKKRRRHSSGDSDDSDLDRKIKRKLKSLKEKNDGRGKESALDTILMHKFNKLKEQLSQQDLNDILSGRASSGSSEESDGDKKMGKKNEDQEQQKRSKKRLKRSTSDSSDSPKSSSDEEDQKKQKKSFGLVTAQGKKIHLKRNKESPPSKTKKKSKSVSKEALPSSHIRERKKPLSEEEKERLRREMMKDAQRRDKERADNLKCHREKEKHEEEMSKSRDFSKEFMHRELIKSTNTSSVESRIKSNLNNIQRSSRHMDTHFSKRH